MIATSQPARLVRDRASSLQGSSRVASRRSRWVGLALFGATLLSGCDAEQAGERAETATASRETAVTGAGGQLSDHEHGTSAREPGPRRPAGPPAIALTPRARAALTAVSVSAHAGSVLIRKEGSAWVMRGRGGCSVPLSRVERALDSLARLRAVATNAPVPDGRAFQLQITLLIDQERAIHLEVADRTHEGDLARLDDDSMVRVQGLDRKLWSPHPADWCREP